MARKDVDLVIRAKDEAAKVVDTITKALNEFIAAQSELGSQASKTETTLGKLGVAVAGLDKAITGLDLGVGLAAQIERSANAVSRLEGEVAGARQEVSRLGQELARSEAITTRYAAKMAGAAQALERQKEAVAKAKVEQKGLSAAYEEAAAVQAKLAGRQAALPGLIAKQSDSVQKAEARYRDLALAIEAASKPSASLIASFDAAGRSVTEKRNKLIALESEYAGLDGKLRAASSAVTIFGDQAARAASNLSRQQVILSKIEENYADLGQRTKTATAAQNNLDDALDRATDSLNRQVSTLERAQGSYEGLVGSAREFNAALSGSSTAARSGLESQLVEQGQAAARAREEYQQLEAVAYQLGRAVGAVGVPTRELAQEFALAKQEANEAQMVYLLQQEALENLGRALAETNSDLRSLVQTQGRFVSEQERLAAAMQSTANDGFRERQAIKELHAANQEAVGSTQRLSRATRENASAAERNAAATTDAAKAYRALHGDTRQALSFTQRLRGEVLSLIAAYGGLYGVINLLGQVVEAYQTLEAAQARLNVANTGDINKTASDLDFLRRTADSLGVEFGSLAQEYSKFAIATQGTALAGDKTRKIFLSVAQAARVNRTSAADMSGVFVALTQIVSKGAVQMEELRQQLGDRLPGALQIMAAGLGVTTAELIKMMEQGQVTADALVPFAEELDKRFGPGLSEALGGSTVALGQLKNAAFQALLAFGNAGFMESFTAMLKDLTELIQSADFRAFIETLSTGFAFLADAVAFAARNFQFFAVALAAVSAVKITPFIVGLVTSLGTLKAELIATQATSAAVAGAMGTVGAAATGAAGGVTLLGRALAVVRANPIGLLLTAAAAAFTYWNTQADEANEALITHRELVDAVKNAYEAAGGDVEKWRKGVEGLTVTEAKRNLEDLTTAIEDAGRKLRVVAFNDGETFAAQFFGLSSFTGASQEYNAAVEEVIQKWRAGGMSAKQLLDAMDEVNQRFDDGSEANKRYGRELIDAIKPMVDLEAAQDEARKVVDAFTGSTEEAGNALDDLTGRADDAGRAVSDGFNQAMTKLADVVDRLQEAAPQTKKGINEIADLAAEFEMHYEEALKAARALPDAIMRAAAEQQLLNDKAAALRSIWDSNQEVIDGGFSGSIVDRIIGVESGGNASARNPNSTATGAGQFIESTWLRMFKQYFPDRAQGMTDAMILALREDAQLSRQMVELYLRENAQILQRAGVAITDANLYLAHFLGPGGAVALLQSAPGTIANSVLGADQVAANKSILDGKTREEIIAWAQRKVGISNEELQIQETLIENDKDRADAVKKAADAAIERAEGQAQETADRIAGNEEEIRQQELILAGKEREAAIQKAIAEARKENPNITAAETEKIREQTGALFDLEQAQKQATTSKERAQDAESKVNDLLSVRTSLLDQIAAATARGDTGLVTELQAKVGEVNAQLLAAIENAKQMWLAVGGTEADAAIAKLDAAKMEAQDFSFMAQENYLQWERVTDLIINGLAGAFDTFSQKVAEGENAAVAARDAFLQFASDFLREIAQMIIKQAIFNALQALFGGTKFGSLIGLTSVGTAHTGGVVGGVRVGSGNASRRVSPEVFAGALRYHTGGVVGLAPNEVPIIAKRNEEVLTEDDPRNILNQGSGAAAPVPQDKGVKVINAIDAASFLEAALASPSGEKVILNWLRANGNAVSNLR